MNPPVTIPNLDYGILAPFIIVALTGVIALIIEMVRPRQGNGPIVAVSLFGLLGAAVASAAHLSRAAESTAADTVISDGFSSAAQLIILLGTALSIAFSDAYLREKKIPFAEVYPLMVWSALGAMLLVSTESLLTMFVGLEILSVSIYVLAGLSREEERSQESAMKYFLLGAFASGFLLLGIAFVFGAGGSVHLDSLRLLGNTANGDARLVASLGLGLLLVGFGFKASFAPFHQWTPDVYQGSPTNVTAYMAAVSKVGAIGAIYRILDASPGFTAIWVPALSVIAAITMFWGNLVALRQTDVKRILGYSSVAQAGYMLVGLIAQGAVGEKIGPETTLYFLLSYTLMTVGAFAVISLTARRGREGTELKDLHGLWRQSPMAAFALVVFMASLIGIPFTGGFVAKALVFSDALRAGLAPLAIILAVNSIISVSYYLAIIRAALTSAAEDQSARAPMTVGVASAATFCAVGVVAAFFFYSPISALLGQVR